ncbi:MAG: glycogen/starch synthase [Prolixibacteraceae bacterium]|jgi:starch synthase|nr:glycogen/starch synthase [Prolixibacteraceae bacterium]
MEKKKILFIFQEITPYLPESEKSKIGRFLPQGIQEQGKEIRTFMPRYGAVNERRNQLHEVIRLSGMNLIIDDMDHPLIIKVASIQAARMQVYFIDNEDYFHHKYLTVDKQGKLFEDNDERAIFYAKGVLETVIKLRWAPDLIHCQGWFGAIVPLLIKKSYADDPLFSGSKVVYTVHNDAFNETLDPKMLDKLTSDYISKEDVAVLQEPNYLNISKLALQYADGIIIGSPEIDPAVAAEIKNSNLPVLEYQGEEEYVEAYNKFYDTILSND